MASWHDRYWTSSDGLKLHYREYEGPADRPPVVCLHGLTRNSRDFEELADHLAGDWRVIAVDFRGRGESDRDADPNRYTPQNYAADMLKLLDELEIGKAVFVGTSLGGIVTMVIAAFAPDRIAGVVLNDAGPEVDQAGLDRIRSYVGQPVLFSDWDDAAQKMAVKYADVHPAYGLEDWKRYARRVGRETEDGVIFDYDMAIAEPFKEANSRPAADAWPLYRALAGRPVLILRGELSDLLSDAIVDRMLDALPDAEAVTVPGVGHAPDLAEPESERAIDRFLERVASA